MFERMKFSKSIYEGVVTPFYLKNIVGQQSTILDSLVIREDNPPCQTLTSRSMRALEIPVFNMLIG